jgi:antitoxin (DNA-binding transcriptional repressor) of toxin-antitoxin stability system
VKIANLATVKNQLSRHVAYVRRGGRVRILVNGVAAADLVPVTSAEQHDDELDELQRAGIVRRGSGIVPVELSKRGPKLRGVPSATTIASERDAGW